MKVSELSLIKLAKYRSTMIDSSSHTAAQLPGPREPVAKLEGPFEMLDSAYSI